jgi:DNA-directed RNA polymerase specialized sigma24 family protein
LFSVTALADDVRRAARAVATEWPGTISAEEVEQEIYLRLLEAPDDIEKFLRDMTERERFGALRNIGHRVAASERADYDVFRGNYRYSVGEVRDLLKGGVLAKERKDIQAERLDVDEALARISPRRRAIVWSEYVTGDYDKTEGAARKELTRAVDSLTDAMNKVYRNRQADYVSGPGSRRAVSNTHAQAITSNAWSEG